MQTLAGEELAALVAHLKIKWASLNEAYQRLPCVLDTPSKKRRKEVRQSSRGRAGCCKRGHACVLPPSAAAHS